MVNDGGYKNYEEARELFANPEKYLEWKEDEMKKKVGEEEDEMEEVSEILKE
jgi:hypothetical protein